MGGVSTVDLVFQDLWGIRTLAAPTGRVFARTEPNVTRMRTASNLLENRTMCASARLVGLEMERCVDRTGILMVGPTLTCPVKRRDAVWTTVSTLQTLVKRIAMAMALVMLATTTQTTTESRTHPTTVHICPTSIRRTRTKTDWETSATQTRTMTEFL